MPDVKKTIVQTSETPVTVAQTARQIKKTRTSLFFSNSQIMDVPDLAFALGVLPNAAYFLLGELGQPVIVFAVSGLGTPASRRHAVEHTDDSGINQTDVAAWLLANADY
jgi:hypothetical protein